MSQTVYNLSPAVGVPGQLQDSAYADIVSYTCSEPITPGCLVELANGQIRMPQQTGSSLGPVVGVAMYDPMREPLDEYSTGSTVAVVRRGRVFVNWNGTTQSDLTAPNVEHSSTTATNRGFFTDAATSTTAGSEIAAAPSGVLLVRDTGSTTMALVELNLL